MLSIDFIRENKEKVISAAKNKGRKVDINGVLELDDKRKSLIQEIQKLREKRNILAKEKVTEEIKNKGKKLKDDLKKLEDNLKGIEKELNEKLSQIPNVPLDEVPVGKDYSDNKELRKWGELPDFKFKPKSHLELGAFLDVIDFERGAKVSGFRGYFLKNELAMLHIGLLFLVFGKLSKKGYVPFIAPAIVKSFSLFGTGQFPWGRQEVYQLNDDDAYLAGTSETPITSYYSGEILDEKELPKKMVAFSPCFRREAGAYGKDTKGLYRLHEFWKVEQVVISDNNLDNARNLHEELQQNVEEILQELNLPYRVLMMSTAETGEPQIIKYDTETWMPSRGTYGETMSNSIMGDFQTRRLNIKYRTNDGKTNFCFSLNNTALASPRILISILENYQQGDGSVLVPKVLQPFVEFDVIRRK